MEDNMNEKFVLGKKVSGSIYLGKGIQGLAGREVVPVGFEVRRTDPTKSVLAVICGKDGRNQPVHLCYFQEHPLAETLRGQAIMI